MSRSSSISTQSKQSLTDNNNNNSNHHHHHHLNRQTDAHAAVKLQTATTLTRQQHQTTTTTMAAATRATDHNNNNKNNNNNSNNNELALEQEPLGVEGGDQMGAAAGHSDGQVVNFMSKFRDKDTRVLKNLNSTQFMEVWNNYDKDANGYIEGRELDHFLREFVASVSVYDLSADAISSKVLAELKQTFLEAYDENSDGKIDIRELAQLLPLEESFLLLFRFDNPLDSSVEFMKIWTNYDRDGSGYIEADELKSFLNDLLKESRGVPVGEDKIIEYTDTILQIFDSNRDGKLQLSEMARLLPVKENFLNRSAFKGASKVTKDDIERVFVLYDRDQNGTIENEELKGFLKDLLELVKRDYDAHDLAEFQDAILRGCDFNKDGKINKKELTMVLLALSRHANQENEQQQQQATLEGLTSN